MTDVLLVTTTMGMVHGVHGHTSDSGPGSSALRLPPVPGVASLADGLVGPAAAGDEADHGAARPGDGGPGSGGQAHTGLLLVL